MTTTIRNGSVRVKIFTNRTRLAAKGDKPERIYVRHEIRWTDHHGKRHRLKKSKLSQAREEAQRIADDLARGHHHAELSLADLASFRGGIVNLYGTGKTIEVATAEYAELVRMLKAANCDDPPKVGIAFYLANRTKITVTAASVQDCVLRFLQTKEAQGVSLRYRNTLKGQLTRFAADFDGPIREVTAADVQSWYLGLDDAGARTRNNHLRAVQNLFRGADLRHHPERQAVLDIQPIQHSTAANALWTPEEFKRLLAKASDHLIPVLVLGGFGKLRSSEIMRTTWENIRLKEKRILLSAGQTKTRRWRSVPLPANAVAWLRPLAGQGKVWPWATQKFNADLRALAKGCGLEWKPNAMRNSAVTYDQTLNPDLARVAREAGNSPAVLEREYLSLHGVSVKQARAWFKIAPEKAGKIVKLCQAK